MTTLPVLRMPPPLPPGPAVSLPPNPPDPAEFAEIVLPVTFSVPALLSPPPEPPGALSTFAD